MTTTMTAEAAQLELRRRIRRYFLVVLGGLVLAFALPFIVGMLMVSSGADKEAAAGPAAVAGFTAMFSVVALSWFLVYRWWRCPVCDRNVYWLVSTNMSVFAATASKNCPGCGTQIIAADAAKRFFIRLFIIVGVFMALGVLSGLASARH